MSVAFGRGLSGCIRRLSVIWRPDASGPPAPDPDLRGAVTGCSSALGPGEAQAVVHLSHFTELGHVGRTVRKVSST